MLRTLSRQAVGLLIAAVLASFAVASAHAGTLTLSGLSCTSLVVGGSQSQGWTVSCTSMTCSLLASNSNPAPGSSITLTANCDSGANSYTYATTTGGCTTPSGSGTQATVSESAVRNCTYQVTGTNTGNNVQGQATTAVSWSTGTPAAPTGCNESANQTSFTAAGGTINLSASCTTPASGIVWSWTRNGAQGWSTLQNPSEVLPANGGSGAVTYNYQATACNGPSVSGGANCVIITPQVSASVAGNGGGGISCPGFNTTVVMDIDWANGPWRQTTAGFGPNDILVVRFTTGGLNTPPNNLANLNAQDPNTSQLFGSLSTSACDFGGSLAIGANSAGTTVSVPFAIGVGGGFGYYPELQTNRQYFFNVKNQVNPSCASTGNCNIVVTLQKPGGI